MAKVQIYFEGKYDESVNIQYGGTTVELEKR